jgi:hypothetical protein
MAHRLQQRREIADQSIEYQSPSISVAETQIPVICEVMRTLTVRFLVAALFLAGAAVAFANPFKSRIITGTDSALVITVPDDHFMKITNFTQEGGTERAVVTVKLGGESPGKTDVLSATRIDLSTGANSQNLPEIGNRVIIAGPAEVSVQPVVGAKLFITYRKERDEGNQGGGGGGGGTPTPFPIFSPTPGVTPTPSATPFIFPTP